MDKSGLVIIVSNSYEDALAALYEINIKRKMIREKIKRILDES